MGASDVRRGVPHSVHDGQRPAVLGGLVVSELERGQAPSGSVGPHQYAAADGAALVRTHHSTGHTACRATLTLTEPSNRLRTGPRPRDPRHNIEAWWARLSRTSRGSWVRTRVWTGTEGASAATLASA